MATFYNPQTVTDGLVFYLDGGNVQKSWKGKPTTNLKTNPEFSDGLTTYGSYCSTAPTLTTIYDFPESYGKAKTVLQCYSAASNCGGGNPGGMAFGNPTLTTGLAYTISFWARAVSHTSLSTTYSNQNGAGDQSNFSFSKTITNQWAKYSYTVSSLDLMKSTWYVWANSVNAIWQYADFQIEQQSFATPYTGGARSTAQVLIDLTNNSTITANSLTYNTDNTFSFNGSSDYISTSMSSFSLYCLDVWLYNNNAVPNNDTTIGGPSTYQTLVQFNSGYPGGINLGAWTSGMTNEAVQIWNANSSQATYNRTAVPVGWHNFVFNWNGSTYDIWIDGVKTTTYASSAGHATLQSITSLQIGYSSPGYYFNGRIVTIKCYNKQLSDQQVLINYNLMRTRFGV